MAQAIYGCPGIAPSPATTQNAGAIYGESKEWIWATPGPLGCPPGFQLNSWGCSFRKSGLADAEGSGKGVWLGVAGLLLSAGIMIAMGFHKPPTPVRRRRRA